MCHTTFTNEAFADKCDCEDKFAIPFRDTLIIIEEEKIKVDLYKKETDRNQYIRPSSCHIETVTTAVPPLVSLLYSQRSQDSSSQLFQSFFFLLRTLQLID